MFSSLSPQSSGEAHRPMLRPAEPSLGEALACRVTHETADGWAAAVHRLSRQAIHVTLGFFLAVGKEVTVEIHNRAGAFSCRQRARIVHALEESDGSFTIWATFLQPLADADLRRLLHG